MPYVASLDPYCNVAAGVLSFGRRLSIVTPGPSDFTVYPKALTVWVPVGTSNPTITILPCGNADGATEVIDLPVGRSLINWVQVRAVTAAAAGVIVRRIDD
jgi:hypothetical protein